MSNDYLQEHIKKFQSKQGAETSGIIVLKQYLY